MNACKLLLIGCVAASFCSTIRAADPPQVRLEGQPNFRDLGGYRTSDGRTVKFGEVFRFGELLRLSDAALEQLQAMGIKTVVSFLTDEEIAARGSNRLPENVKTIRLPIAGGDAGTGGLAGAILEARQTADIVSVKPWPKGKFTLNDKPTVLFEGTRGYNDPSKYTVQYRLAAEASEGKEGDTTDLGGQ